jgi:hypothetical protein
VSVIMSDLLATVATTTRGSLFPHVLGQRKLEIVNRHNLSSWVFLAACLHVILQSV